MKRIAITRTLDAAIGDGMQARPDFGADPDAQALLGSVTRSAGLSREVREDQQRRRPSLEAG